MQKTMEKPTAALLLLTSWDLETDGKSGQPSRSIVRHVKEQTLQSEQISEIFCTVLDVEVSEDQKQDARSVGVTLIPASRNEWSNPEEDPPAINWILHHDQYYPKLKDLPNIAHVVGCHKKTMTAAAKICKCLFPNAKLHEITISRLPSGALFVFKTWETEEQSLTSKPTHMMIKEFCKKTPGLDDKSDIFCTFLDIEVSEDKLKDAKKAGVTLIPAIRNKRLEPHEDPPVINWLANHEIYYPQLQHLQQIKHVIGCDPITKNAAVAIHESLFPKSEFHLLDLPKPPPGALFIGDGWDENDCGLTGFHRTSIQDFLGRKLENVRACATVLDVEISKKQKEDAEKCGVTLIPATRKDKVEPEEDQPKLEWLLNHEIYFPVLQKLENITHVIGYAPKTGRAAADIRDKIFSHAELVLINHAYEDEDCLWEADREKFKEKMLKLAGEADVIFSIGPHMHKYFKNQYRASINGKKLADIPHGEIFPKPRAAFFERDSYLPDDGVDAHCILTYGQINTLEALESCDNLAASIGSVANRRKEMYAKPPEWSLMGIPPLINQTRVTTLLRDRMQSGHIQPKVFEKFSAKTLLTSLHQSHLCLPAPCYKDYGFCGLEAMATGIPTNAFEDSQLGFLITKYFPMHKDHYVVGRYPPELLSEKILKTISNIEMAFESARKLRKDFVESADIDKYCSTFASLLTPKRTLTESGQSSGRGDTSKTADSHHDTTIKVQVKLHETVYQQHIQKVIQNDTNGARKQTMDTAWKKCKDLSKKKVGEIVSNDVTTNKVQKTCVEKFGDGVEVTGMATKSLEISVVIPRLVNLYRMEASCESESFTEALEPIMITDEMKEVAASAGLPLKLIATYDQAKFDKIKLFFLNRDGGGLRRAEIFDGVIEEEFITEMKAESQSLPLQEAMKGNLTTDTEQIVTLQSGKTNEISKLKIQKQIIENDLEEVKHEKSILEKQYADLALRLESAEKVTFTQLKDVQSLKQKLTEVDPKSVHDLKSALKQKENMIVELQTKLSNYEAMLSSLEMQLQQKSAEEHQREEEQLTTAAENTRGWSKFKLEGQGPRPGQKFNNPCGLTFSDDKLLVCDKDNNIVQILNQDYTCEKVLGSFSGQFAKPFKPQSIAVSKENQYFILDDNNLQIVVCDQNDKVIGIITLPADINPCCIALLKGFVLVTDVKGHRLLKYTKTGQYVSEVGSLGAGQTQFQYPWFVAVNSKDVIMVSDGLNSCIKCFDSDFNYLYQYGEEGHGDSQLYSPRSIAVDGADHVYVCDLGNGRISMWSRDGTWICNLFHRVVRWPRYIAVSRDRICVRGRDDKHITVFSK